MTTISRLDLVKRYLAALEAFAVGALRAGDQMRARIGVFLEFEGDRIRRQRNYDCYDAW